MVPCSDRINPKDLHKVMDVLAELEPGYDEIIQTAIHTVKPDNIAIFLESVLLSGLKKEQVPKKFCHFAKKIVEKWPEKKFSLW